MTQQRLFTRPDLIGYTGRRPERDIALTRARRNVYLPTESVPKDWTGKYLLTVRAAHQTLSGDHVFSHESAAVLLGLPSLRAWPTKVHLICERRSGGRSQLDVVRHCIGLEDVEPRLVDGMLVTSPARTAFDLALTRAFDEAVVVADAAFRVDPGARQEFAALLESYGRRRGFQKAAEVLAFADARSESVGESYSRTEIDRLGFEAPDLQVKVVTAGREERGDFGWRRVRTLGEFDGEMKYREDRYRQGGSVEDVVIREKNRENRMRVEWPSIARWDYEDLRKGRLESVLVRAGVPRRGSMFRSESHATRYSSPRRGR